MAFECFQCGECCSTMGEIISIREKISDTGFRIGYSTTGEERVVVLDPDKQHLFVMKTRSNTLACPFLREQTPGRSICTAHHSRPELCRQYSCYRILVLDRDGRRAGKVWDRSQYFTSTDPRLNGLWNSACRGLDIPDEARWEEEIEKILTNAGYQIVR